MTQPQHARLPGKIKLLIACALLALVIPSVLISVLLTKAHFDERRAGKAVAETLEEIRAMGMPVSTQDLSRIYPPIASSDDITRYLGETLELLVPPPEESRLPFVTDAAVTLRGQPRDPVSLKEMETYIATNGAALRKLPHNWPPSARLGVGWEVGLTGAPSIKLTAFQPLFQVLGVKALYCAETRDASGAVQAIRQGLMVSSAMRDDWMLSLLFRRFAESVMSKATEATLNQVLVEERDLRELADLFGSVRTDGLCSCVPVHYVLGIHTMQKLKQDYDQLAFRNKALLTVMGAIRGKALLLYSDADLLALLQRYRAMTEICGLPFRERLAELGRFDQEEEEPRRRRGIAYLIAEIPEWGSKFQADGVISARLLVTRVALAVELYRHQHGDRLPDALSDLVPDFLPKVPQDPFAGRSLRYVKYESGYLVYSVGPDGVDQGGRQDTQHGSEADATDITFRVERLER